MVKMVPPGVAPKTNWSEREVFTAFEGVLDRPDWIVLHSLKLAQHIHGLESEADFIVFVPGRGIVVIETKNPKFVEYRDGQWYLDRVPNPTKDPLAQLSKARSSIRSFLKGVDENIDEVPIARMLWFTNIGRHQFNIDSPGDMQFFEWELGLAEDKAAPVKAIEKVLDRHTEFFSQNGEIVFNPAAFDAERAEFLASSLLNDFKGYEDAEAFAQTALRIEQRLLGEQLAVLDLVETNRHVYFDGSAGTGKSFLIAESARRLAKQGHRVLVTCWNVLMAGELALQVREPGVRVADLNTVMLELCGLESNPDGAGTDWYERELPQLVAAAIEADPTLGRATAVCVDEFQDIASNLHLIKVVLLLAAATGTERATFVLAGDKNQQIMRDGDDVVDPYTKMKSILKDLVHVRLRTNCRTAPELAKRIPELVRIRPDIKKHRMPAGLLGVGAEVIEVSEAKQSQKVASVVKRLLTRYRPHEIVILSPFGEHGSVVGQLVARGEGSTDERALIASLQKEGVGGVRWRSIAKFKGLESPVVVITDVTARAQAFAQSLNKELDELLYVGITRAKYECVLICEPGVAGTHGEHQEGQGSHQ